MNKFSDGERSFAPHRVGGEIGCSVVEVDMIGYLQSKGVAVKKVGPSDFNVPCFWCGEDPQKRGRLYINNDPLAEPPNLFMCLAGETQVQTWEGIKPIASLAGTTQRLLTTHGRWVDAPIHSFGVQSLMKLIVSRNGMRKEIFATPEHQWLLRRSSKARRRVETQDLLKGDRLAFSYPRRLAVSDVRPSPFGIAHGIVFGDGTLAYKGSCVRLFGEKDSQLLKWFPHNFTYNYLDATGNPYTQVTDLPAYFKDFPSINESPSYLYGWLAGYFAADGDVTKAGAVSINSASYEALDFVRSVCTRIGIGTFGISSYKRVGITGVVLPIYRLRFIPNDLTEDFFLTSEHRLRWNSTVAGLAYERRGWVVVSVEATNRVEEVFCAVVAGTHSFTLDDNILTGNCHLCGRKGARNAIYHHFGDKAPQDHKGEDTSSYTTHAILQEAAAYYHNLLGEQEEVLKWLKYERGLTVETLVAHQIGWADGTLKAHLVAKGYSVADLHKTGLVDQSGRDFLHAHVTIPYHTTGNVTLIRGKDMRGKYLTPPGQKARLYNSDTTWNAESIIVTEGEFDALVVEQLGYATVGCPGATSWQDSWNDYFSEAKKVFVVFDNDAPGIAGAEKVARAIGPKARIVKMPEAEAGAPKNDPSEWIAKRNHGKDDFQLLLVKSRGGHLLSVDDCYTEWLEVQDMQGLKLGFAALDERIKPGLLPAQVMIVLAKTNVGKSTVIDTVIPTPKGYTKMGDLVVGDEVFGRNGKPTKVLGVFDQGLLPTFRMAFRDHTYVDCSPDHIWTVRYRYGHKREWHEKTMTTSQIMESGLRHGKEYKYEIPLPEPIRYPDAQLPIEPYTLGSLIANGSMVSGSVVLITPDDEVVNRIAKHYTINRYKVDETKYCPKFGLPGLIGLIRKLGLDLHSRDKIIPEAYLQASVEQRIALLQGLMDGDGSVSKRGTQVYYHTTSRQLSDDVCELVRSLGGTAIVQVIDRTSENKPIEYRVCVIPHESVPVFSSSRKVRTTSRYEIRPRRTIVSIEQIEDADQRCIAVDAEDNLYVVGREYIVTHNTLWTLNVFQRMCMENPEVRILFVSLEQTRGDWFERARRIHRFYNLDSTNEDCLDYFRHRLMVVDKNRVTEVELVDCIEQYEFEIGEKPDLVAIDYLGYWARSFKGEAYERMSAAIMALKAIAKEHRIVILAPHQVSRGAHFGEEFEMDDARDSGVVEETADFILTLWSPDVMKGKKEEEKTGIVNMKIAKSRHGGKGSETRLQFAPLSLAMVPHGDALVQRARDELDFALAKDDFEIAMHRHKTGNRRIEPPMEIR